MTGEEVTQVEVAPDGITGFVRSQARLYAESGAPMAPELVGYLVAEQLASVQ